MSNPKVGDKVKVVRQVEKEKGWNNNWTPSMDDFIGCEAVVTDVDQFGVKLDIHDGFGYPPSSLEVVPTSEPAPELMYCIANIYERKGETEFKATFLMVASNPKEALGAIAESWRLEEAEWSEEYAAYDHGDGIAVWAGEWKEIKEVTFKDLEGLVTVLWRD